jgi:hypothetical protein
VPDPSRSDTDAIATVDAATLRELFAVPPEEFVSRRNATVKALKAAGERAQAATVAKLRRPSVVDWALNVTAIERPKVVADFLDAGASLRESQEAAAEGRRGGDVRSALQELRRQTNAVLTAANKVLASAGRSSGPLAGPLTSRLSAVAVNRAAGDQLRAGRLGSVDVEAESDDPFAGLTPPPSDRGSRTATKPARRAKAAKGTEAAHEPATREETADDARERRRERAAAEREVATARTALTKADTEVEKTERAVNDALGRVETARARLEAAEQRRDEARDALERVIAAVDALDR